LEDYQQAMGKIQSSIGSDASKWNIGDLKRGPDGKFSDAAMGQILIDA
jgi:hypothetical protein